MNTTNSPPPKATRQCWYCIKHRLVCDYTLPHCIKCIKKGRDCPGYDAQKPLQWVEPGRISSRKRRNAPPSKGLEVLPARHRQLARPAMRRSQNASSSDSEEEEKPGAHVYKKYTSAWINAKTPEDMHRIIELQSRDKIQYVVSQGLKSEAARMLKLEKDPLKGLQRVLRHMQLQELPSYNLLDDTCEIVQAIHYFNSRVIPYTQQSNELVHNHHMIPFSMSALHLLPPTMHSSFVCIALNHYLCTLPTGTGKEVVASVWPRLWQHRGHAIRDLSERIANQSITYGDTTISSVLVFLSHELQTSLLPNWRTHIDVLLRIFEKRGGIMHIYRESLHMQPTVVLFIMIVTFANFSSPGSQQINIAQTPEEQLSIVNEVYESLFPYLLCPRSLYLAIWRIGFLRTEASLRLLTEESTADLLQEAAQILAEIDSFSPQDWAQQGLYYTEWVTISSCYKHAIAIYCIMSMQSLAVFPMSPQLIQQRTHHSDRLVSYIREAMLSDRLKRFLTAPILAVGVEAAYRSEARRKWVADSLVSLSRTLGTIVPIKIAGSFREYWDSGDGDYGWEQFFWQPYALMFS